MLLQRIEPEPAEPCRPHEARSYGGQSQPSGDCDKPFKSGCGHCWLTQASRRRHTATDWIDSRSLSQQQPRSSTRSQGGGQEAEDVVAEEGGGEGREIEVVPSFEVDGPGCGAGVERHDRVDGAGHHGEPRAFGEAHIPAHPAGHHPENRAGGEEGGKRGGGTHAEQPWRSQRHRSPLVLMPEQIPAKEPAGGEREADWQGEPGEQSQAERLSGRRPRNRPGSSLHSSLNSGIEIGSHLPDGRMVASAD